MNPLTQALAQLETYLDQHEEGLTITLWGSDGNYRVDCRNDFGIETRSDYGEGATITEALTNCLHAIELNP